MQILLKRLWEQDDVTITVVKNTQLFKMNFFAQPFISEIVWEIWKKMLENSMNNI
jgi:hypothetical protein